MKTLYQIMKNKNARKIVWNSDLLRAKIISNGYFAVVETPSLSRLNLEPGSMLGDFIWTKEKQSTYEKCKVSLTGFSDTIRFEIPDTLHCEYANKQWHDAIVKEFGGEVDCFLDKKLLYSPILYKMKGHLVAALQPKKY